MPKGNRNKKYKDLTGQTFGNLTVVKPIGKDKKSGHMWWECKCSCGNSKAILAHNMKAGRTRSCGCLRKFRSKKATPNSFSEKIMPEGSKDLRTVLHSPLNTRTIEDLKRYRDL